jgi:hypothetical protein
VSDSHHPNIITPVDKDQGKRELLEPQFLDTGQIWLHRMAFRIEGDDIQALCHSPLETIGPKLTTPVPIKTDRFLHLGPRFRVELHWLAVAGHLHFFEGRQRICPLDFAGINLVYPPLNLCPESRIKSPGFFALMDGLDQMLMER